MRSFEAGGLIRFGSLTVPPERVKRGGSWNRQTEELAFGESQQEHHRKPEQQQRFSDCPYAQSARTDSIRVLFGVQRSVQGRS